MSILAILHSSNHPHLRIWWRRATSWLASGLKEVLQFHAGMRSKWANGANTSTIYSNVMFNNFEPTCNVLVWRITGSKTFKAYNKDHLQKYLAIIQVGDESPLSQGYNPLTKGIMTTVAHRLFVTVLEWWRRSPDPALSSWHLRRMWAIRILCEGFCCLTPDLLANVSQMYVS